MNFLNRLNPDKDKKANRVGQKMTTKGLFFGAPEAEAEISQSARINLYQVFGDYLDALKQLKTEKFIITGRKGCGKSAIAEYIQIAAAMQPNVFVDFIKKADIDFERVLQIAAPVSVSIEAQTILEWLILVRFCDQLVKNESIATSDGHKNLKKFFDRNRGLVELKDFELKALVETKKGEVSIELFQRAVRGLTGKTVELRMERAPFYRLMPYLKDVLIELL
ncbi:MAG: hypothetical protein CFE44_25910, partial [Burkholderiales bacterium PBB4]